jgi:hypothetical protein
MLKVSTMRLAKTLVIAAAGAVGALALGAATRPAALAQAAPGVWEVSGMPGTKKPILQCVGDLLALAQFEHRGESCSRRVIRDSGSSASVEYSCPSGGFGRSEIGLITPRSLRIETQGISDGLPFHYVIQARRMGDCPSHQTASRH